MLNAKAVSIYIHIPFCRSRCNYCDFNTYAGMGVYLDDYVEALIQEIRLAHSVWNSDEPVHSIYFGGGTPTLMQPQQFERILESIGKNYPLAEQVEISTEANPYLLTLTYLKDLHEAGVRRLSMGMQSGNPVELELLGRSHRMADVIQSVDYARQAGFDNLNLDLIFGIPDQSLGNLQESLGKALELKPNHLSIYSLSIEEGTPLEHMLQQGKIPQPDAEVSADMYEWLMEFLEGQGFRQYEISNWAAADEFRCLHNLQYWHDRYYLGFGAGAHSYFKHQRWANTAGIADYIQRVNATQEWHMEKPTAADEVLLLTEWDEIQETMMMGLRLTEEGVSAEVFQNRFGQRLENVYAKEIKFLTGNGLLEWMTIEDVQHLRLTPRGRMLGNQVFMQFIEA